MKTRSAISKKVRLSGKILSGKARQKARAQLFQLPFKSAGDADVGKRSKLCSPYSALTINIAMNEFLGGDDWEDMVTTGEDAMDIDRILEGKDTAHMSHAGGEFMESLEREMRQERYALPEASPLIFWSYLKICGRGMRKDSRDRRDRVIKRTQAFENVLGHMVDSYLEWAERRRDSVFSDYHETTPLEAAEGVKYEVSVIDVFRLFPLLKLPITHLIQMYRTLQPVYHTLTWSRHSNCSRQ